MASVSHLRKLLDAILGDDRKYTSTSKFVDGTLLSVFSTLTLGQPFEVWKTRMGRHRGESTVRAFRTILATGGVRSFWAGTGPKVVESATKGGVLLVVKECIQKQLKAWGASPTVAGFLSGAGGGVAQTIVMAPCTFLVTAQVLGSPKSSLMSVIQNTYASKGLLGFYAGSSAVAARQASNWASRVGFTEAVRSQIASVRYGSPTARLSITEECWAGIIGGVLSCWNHPFEVARIEMQARTLASETPMGMLEVLRHVHRGHGLQGLFQGLLPRMGTNVWLTLAMVSGANIVQQLREGSERSARKGAQLANTLSGAALQRG